MLLSAVTSNKTAQLNQNVDNFKLIDLCTGGVSLETSPEPKMIDLAGKLWRADHFARACLKTSSMFLT